MPRVDVDMSSVTVSGISSGAFMAVQLHISFSQTFNGVGALAGGPYWCAMDSVETALSACMADPDRLDPTFLSMIVESTANTGFADPVSNLADSRVWLMSAMNDSVVLKGVVEAAGGVYKPFLRHPTTQLATVYNVPGEHSQVTMDYGNPCLTLGKPFINSCDFDAAGDMLQHVIRHPLMPPNRTGARLRDATELQGKLSTFDQSAFVFGPFSGIFGMEQTGYVYVPKPCEDQAHVCPLHVALHGCEMTLDDIGDSFVLHGGYIPWADANGIILLFPQAKANVLNPKGCWDWWGYAGTAYASNIGSQTLAVKRMVDALSNQPLTPNRTGVFPGLPVRGV